MIWRGKLNIYRGSWLILMLVTSSLWANEVDKVILDVNDITIIDQATDLSIQFLQSLFGYVPGVSGFISVNPIITAIFTALNIGLLCVIGMRFAWNIITQVLLANTEGDQLSRKIKPMTTIRSLGGIALLVPTTSGFSYVQILMLYIVTQGIGLANVMWSATVDLIKGNQGQFIVQSSYQDPKEESIHSPEQQKFADIKGLIGDGDTFIKNNKYTKSMDLKTQNINASIFDFFAASVCAHSMYWLDLDDDTQNISPNDYGFRINCALGSNQCSFMFGSKNDKKACGEIGLSQDNLNSLKDKQNKYNSNFGITESDGASIAQGIQTSAFEGMYSIVQITDRAAQQWVSRLHRMKESYGDNYIERWLNLTPSEQYCLNDQNPNACQEAKAFVAAATDMYQDTLSARLRISQLNDAMSTNELSQYEEMRQSGWTGAGIYFNQMMLQNNKGHVVSDGKKQQFASLDLFRPIIMCSIPTVKLGTSTLSQALTSCSTYDAVTNNKIYQLLLNKKAENAYCSQSQFKNAKVCKDKQDNKLLNRYIGSASEIIKGYQPDRGGGVNLGHYLPHQYDSVAYQLAAFSHHNLTEEALKTSQVSFGLMLNSIGTPIVLSAGFNSLPTLGSILSAAGARVAFGTTALIGGGVVAGLELVNTLYAKKDLAKMFITTYASFTGLNFGSEWDVDQWDKDTNFASSKVKNMTFSDCYKVCSEEDGCLQALKDKSCIKEGYGMLGTYVLNEQGGLIDPLAQLRQIGQHLLKISSSFFANIVNDSWVNESTLLDLHAGFDTARYTGAANIWLANWYNPPGRAMLKGSMQVFSGLLTILNSIDQTIMNVYKPIGYGMAAVLFGMGIILGYLLPYLPMVIYIMAIVGWLLLVIESMIAAPIVALGLANPSHHDVLGKAEQSLILLLQVFLRPACILLGLAMAMFMLYVSMEYLNMGFLYFIGNDNGLFTLFQNGDSDNLLKNVVVMGGIILVYTYLSYVVVTYCLSLMYTIPEKIARWLDPSKGDPQAIALSGQTVDMLEQQVAGEGGDAGKISSGAQQSGRRNLQPTTTRLPAGINERNMGGKNRKDTLD
ncbi:MAG: DotA/TraY family protein [Candidatus Comchoanobacterales bacterium]